MRRKLKPVAPCADCAVDTLITVLKGHGDARAEFYMVHDHVWEFAGLDSSCLCIGCLEARLGRQLHSGDFTSAPVNDLAISDTRRYAWSWRSSRLVNRLTAPSSVQLALW